MDYFHNFFDEIEVEIVLVHTFASVIGPRQCGKSTLLEHYQQQSKSKWQYFNMDIRALRSKVEAEPDLFIKDFESNIIIDEVKNSSLSEKVLKLKSVKLQRYLVSILTC